MNVERACLLIDDHREESVEAFGVCRRLEPLLRHEDGDIRNTVATLAPPIAAQGDRSLRRKEITCNLCAETPRDRDDRRAIGDPRIRVVDSYGSSPTKGLSDQLFLPPLRLPVVTHGILADQVVSSGKAFPVERRLA